MNRLGLFDDPSLNPFFKLGPDDMVTPSHLALSEEAAREGIVLLSNPNSLFPLDVVGVVAVVGPLGFSDEVMKGNYAGQPPFIWNVYDCSSY